MQSTSSCRLLLFVLGLSLSAQLSCGARSEPVPVRLAVASNFRLPAEEIARAFEKESGVPVAISTGSTGKLYSQIKNGAPFDVILAAYPVDLHPPGKDSGVGFGNKFIYAVGKLVLWSSDKDLVDAKGEILESKEISRIAIADPKLAPYGRAAIETLEKLNIFERVEDRLVYGQNVGQAIQFVVTGNAEVGFVSQAQIKGLGGSVWEVPEHMYSPIEQQAVLINTSPKAKRFIEFLKGDVSREIIRNYGYGEKK